MGHYTTLGERESLRREISETVLLLIVVGTVALVSCIRPARAGFDVQDYSAVNGTLIERIRYYLNSSLVDWTDNYYGLIFSRQTKTDFENFVDRLNDDSDWLNVMTWSVRLKKLGIEREFAIKNALGNITKAGELPKSGEDSRGSYWFVYDRELLYSVYYYANKYGYLTDKWNVTKGYAFLRDAIIINGSSNVPSAFHVYEDGGVTRGNNRYYDENAQTASAFLIFYELGVDAALDSAKAVWNYVNSRHWSETGQYYSYQPTWDGFECESPYFFKIFSLLQYWDQSTGNLSRIVTDVQTRFLNQSWESPQWRESPTGTVGYAVMHMNPSNSQRRLQNTLGAWFTMLGAFNLLNSTSQNKLRNMLKGYGGYDPAWKLLYHPDTRLYDSSTGMFRMTSTNSPTTDATSMALTLQALMGVVPINTTIAFPLEEYHYEYNFDVDPDLFRIDSERNTLQIAIANEGTLEFIYGELPVTCSFRESGIYNLVFSRDWNSIVSVSRLQDLPANRRFALNLTQMEHDIAITNVLPSSNVVQEGSDLSINVTVQNRGKSPEVFNVTMYSNQTIIDEILDVSLPSSNSTSITFNWNTSGFQKGEYIISARADAVAGESSIGDNALRVGTPITIVSNGHDVAVKDVLASRSLVTATVKNYGTFAESFNVTVYANTTLIGQQNVTIGSGTTTTISFSWNTTGWPRGNYVISVVAEPVPGETDVSDNCRVTSPVLVVPLADTNGDGYVGIDDILAVVQHFGQEPGLQGWNPIYDFNGDDYVGIDDLVTAVRQFGEENP